MRDEQGGAAHHHDGEKAREHERARPRKAVDAKLASSSGGIALSTPWSAPASPRASIMPVLPISGSSMSRFRRSSPFFAVREVPHLGHSVAPGAASAPQAGHQVAPLRDILRVVSSEAPQPGHTRASSGT